MSLPVECPWPADIWTMDTDGLVEAIPNEETRSAVTGCMARFGWEKLQEQVNLALIRSRMEMKPCIACILFFLWGV
jgi:hypothetical protein